MSSEAIAPAHNPSGHITFNAQQLNALQDMEKWVASQKGRNSVPYILQGYAGTGKTTLVREMLNRLNISLSRVALIAPTNRAAKVLQNKTGLHTSTIHKLIYLTVREELDFQRLRLEMWKDARNFTELADLIVQSNDTDLNELFMEYGGGNEAEFAEFCESHRVLVLSYEGVTLPDNDAERLDFFGQVKTAKMAEHKENIRELLKEDLKTRRKEAKEVLGRYDLILVDEASMVSETVGNDLMSFGVPTILVGDPFQLPPVKANPYWHNRKADKVLTKIERQKGKGAGIPLAGESLRNGKTIRENDSLTLHGRGSLDNEAYVQADQVICGTHRTRETMCRIIRKELGHFLAWPQVGEKIVATYNDRNNGIMNGELYRVLKSELKSDGRVALMDIQDPYGTIIRDVTCWTEGMEGRNFTNYLTDQHGKFWWGYCITCHQSQGSEWKNVVVCNDWPGREDKDRWLYTAITRASEHCKLVGYRG